MLQIVNREYLGICIALFWAVLAWPFSFGQILSVPYRQVLRLPTLFISQDDHPSIKFRPRPDPPLGGPGGTGVGPERTSHSTG